MKICYKILLLYTIVINENLFHNCFSNDSDSFPNIYDVNKSNPDDNVPTLWAIVNSSSVSFYNVNNIILPKSTDWKNWKKNKESF